MPVISACTVCRGVANVRGMGKCRDLKKSDRIPNNSST